MASIKHTMLAISKQQSFKIVTEEHLENKGVEHSKMAQIGTSSLSNDPCFYDLLWSGITPRSKASFVPPEPMLEWEREIFAPQPQQTR